MDLPPSAPNRFRFSCSVRVYSTYGNLQYHDSRASLGKAYRLPTSRPAPHRFNSPDIRLCLSCPLSLLPNAIWLVRCPLRTRVLPHASSRHPITGSALALLVLLFRPVTVSVLCLPALRQKLGQYAMPGAQYRLYYCKLINS